jgi:hypothetical protein
MARKLKGFFPGRTAEIQNQIGSMEVLSRVFDIPGVNLWIPRLLLIESLRDHIPKYCCDSHFTL